MSVILKMQQNARGVSKMEWVLITEGHRYVLKLEHCGMIMEIVVGVQNDHELVVRNKRFYNVEFAMDYAERVLFDEINGNKKAKLLSAVKKRNKLWENK